MQVGRHSMLATTAGLIGLVCLPVVGCVSDAPKESLTRSTWEPYLAVLETAQPVAANGRPFEASWEGLSQKVVLLSSMEELPGVGIDPAACRANMTASLNKALSDLNRSIGRQAYQEGRDDNHDLVFKVGDVSHAPDVAARRLKSIEALEKRKLSVPHFRNDTNRGPSVAPYGDVSALSFQLSSLDPLYGEVLVSWMRIDLFHGCAFNFARAIVYLYTDYLVLLLGRDERSHFRLTALTRDSYGFNAFRSLAFCRAMATRSNSLGIVDCADKVQALIHERSRE